jgi:hypothetical protein
MHRLFIQAGRHNLDSGAPQQVNHRDGLQFFTALR